MILTDREIKIAVQRGSIKIEPAPDFDIALSSTAIDLTLDSNITLFDDPTDGVEQVLDPSQNTASGIIRAITKSQTIASVGYLLPPKKLILAWTREYIGLDTGTRIAARVEGKSSLARLGLGVHVTAPTIHAGFTGQIQLEMINHGGAPIRLKAGMRICQLIFETTLGTPERGYQGQFLGQTAVRKDKTKLKKRRKAA